MSSKWQGTAVPNTGYIEKVYVNTDLSIEEVESIIENANLHMVDNPFGLDNFNKIYVIYASENLSNVLYINLYDNTDIKFYTLYQANALTMEGNILFISRTSVDENDNTLVAGWYLDDGFININLNLVNLIAGYNISVGAENDKLSSLFSITPFVEVKEKMVAFPKSWVEDLANAIREKEESTEKISGPDIPNRVRLIETGVDTADATAKNIHLSEGYTAYANGVKITGTNKAGRLENEGKVMANSLGGVDIVMDGVDVKTLFIETEGQPYENIVIDQKRLSEFSAGGEGATITTKGGWQGTPVPASGTLSEVYFNTALSVNEVVSLLEQLTFEKLSPSEDTLYNFILSNITQSGGSIAYMVSKDPNNNTYKIFNYMNSEEFFSSDNGWNLELFTDANRISFNEPINVVTSFMGAYAVGAENNKLSSLFSTTPFVQASGEEVKLEGEYDGNTLVIEDITKGYAEGGKLAFPNTGYVEHMHVNTDMTQSEVKDTLGKITGWLDTGESSSIYAVLYNSVFALFIMKMGSDYMMQALLTEVGLEGIIYDDTQGGWLSDGIEFVETYLEKWEVGEVFSNIDGIPIGTDNDKLVDLFYTLPKPNTINVKSLINSKKIPLEIEVNGGGVEIPSVTDLVVENNVATWTAPDFTNVNKYNPTSITYVVSVNETEIETSETTFNISNYLVSGVNTVSVRVKVIYNGIESNIVEYSKIATVTLLNTQLQYNMGWFNEYRASPKLVGTNIYTFGGRGDGTYYNTIHKFDTLTEKVTSLGRYLLKYMLTDTVAVGTNIYTFGGEGDSSTHPNTIAKFNTISETISTLSSTLPKDSTGTYDVHKVYPVVKGNIIYTFGGLYYNSTYNVRTSLPINYILKFDTTTETLEKLSVTLPSEMSAISTVLHNNVIYIFGGYNYNTSAIFNTILKFDTTTETLETLNVTLPKGTDMVYPYKINNIIYLFNARGNAKEVYKFDIATETITTLDVALPSTSQLFIPIGTDVYNFNVKAVYRFDTTTETLEELSIQMLISTANSAYGVINNTIYFFGGYDSAYVKDIYKFTP